MLFDNLRLKINSINLLTSPVLLKWISLRSQQSFINSAQQIPAHLYWYEKQVSYWGIHRKVNNQNRILAFVLWMSIANQIKWRLDRQLQNKHS